MGFQIPWKVEQNTIYFLIVSHLNLFIFHYSTLVTACAKLSMMLTFCVDIIASYSVLLGIFIIKNSLLGKHISVGDRKSIEL